jgi:hypothetical protein
MGYYSALLFLLEEDASHAAIPSGLEACLVDVSRLCSIPGGVIILS